MNQLKILTKNRNRIIVCLLLCFISFASANGKKLITNYSDSIMNIIKYDVEGIKYLEIKKANHTMTTICYYTRNGQKIENFYWKINVKTINHIKDKILFNFFMDDITYSSGKAIILLIADPQSYFIELRLIKGLSSSFNNELVRVLRKIENDIVFIGGDMPVVVPFAIDLQIQRKE